MSISNTGFIVLGLLMVMDLAVLGAVVLFLKRVKTSSHNQTMKKTADLLESLVTDSGKVAEQWRDQIEKKQHVLKQMNEQLEEKLVSLKMVCGRAEALVQSSRMAEGATPGDASFTGREKKIISLARKGRRTKEIADQLDLPMAEVDLVLGLKQKLSRLGAEQRSS